MPSCDGCKRAKAYRRVTKKHGVVISLDDYWALNHFDSKEGFLGWLVLQPKNHVRDIKALNTKELECLGSNIGKITKAIHRLWVKEFPKDKLLRLYVVYFYESAFEKKHKWHMHIHLIARPKSFSDLYGSRENSNFYDGWQIYKVSKQKSFPPQYIYTRSKANALMKQLKQFLTN